MKSYYSNRCADIGQSWLVHLNRRFQFEGIPQTNCGPHFFQFPCHFLFQSLELARKFPMNFRNTFRINLLPLSKKRKALSLQIRAKLDRRIVCSGPGHCYVDKRGRYDADNSRCYAGSATIRVGIILIHVDQDKAHRQNRAIKKESFC